MNVPAPPPEELEQLHAENHRLCDELDVAHEELVIATARIALLEVELASARSEQNNRFFVWECLTHDQRRHADGSDHVRRVLRTVEGTLYEQTHVIKGEPGAGQIGVSHTKLFAHA